MEKYKRKVGTEINAVLVTDSNISNLAKEFRGKVVVEGNLNTKTLHVPTLEGIKIIAISQYLVDNSGFLAAVDATKFESEWEKA